MQSPKPVDTTPQTPSASRGLPDQARSRRPYVPPVLKRWGDVTALTQFDGEPGDDGVADANGASM